jgi:hypothetical protein
MAGTTLHHPRMHAGFHHRSDRHMPKPVEGERRIQPGLTDGRCEYPLGKVSPEHSPTGSNEDQSVWITLRISSVDPPVIGEHVDEERWCRQGPEARAGLRFGHQSQLTCHLLDRLCDGHGSSQEVDVSDTQSNRLAPSQTDDAGDEDQCSIARWDSLS